MPAYIIVEGRNINIEKIMDYVGAVRRLMAASGSLLQKFDGRILFRATPDNYEIIEGEDAPELYQVLEFPSLEKAKGFWLGPEYQEAKKLREGAGDFKIVMVDGG